MLNLEDIEKNTIKESIIATNRSRNLFYASHCNESFLWFIEQRRSARAARVLIMLQIYERFFYVSNYIKLIYILILFTNMHFILFMSQCTSQLIYNDVAIKYP